MLWQAGRIGEGFDVLRRLVSSLVPTRRGGRELGISRRFAVSFTPRQAP